MSELCRQAGSIIGVLALLCACAWWVGRRGIARSINRGGTVNANWLVARWSKAGWLSRKPGTRMLEVVESRTLAPGQALHLVRVGERGVVLASHGAGCTLIESCRWEEFFGSSPLAGQEFPGQQLSAQSPGAPS